MKTIYKELKTFFILWSTQSLSQLGSAMTNFALTLWLYEKTGSALQTALLSICSYAPYVLTSIFAGALSDRWDKKKTMLACDTFAACCSVTVLILLKTDSLRPIHLYILNAVSGLMNTVQQPAGEVAMTLITSEKHYQRTSGLRSFSNSLVTILHPVFATAVFTFAGMDSVISTDLATFAAAFLVLLCFVQIPPVNSSACAADSSPAETLKSMSGTSEADAKHTDVSMNERKFPANEASAATAKWETPATNERDFPASPRKVRRKRAWNALDSSILADMKAGLLYLRDNRLILVLILFLAGVNFVASAFDAALPPYVLSSKNGNRAVLGIVTSCAGIATLAGSLITTVLPAPKNRIRVIYLTMLFSLGTENFILAFARTPFWWCLAQVVGWLPVPLMNANLDVILRSTIPPQMQGRVYSCRNTLQFFTIPIGTFLGGFLIDRICEPLMEKASPGGIPARLFGIGKGSGAALVMFLLGILGVVICLGFGTVLKKYEFAEPAGK